MAKGKEEKAQVEGTELNPTDVEETEFQQEVMEGSSIAKVNLITSEKKVTMSAPMKEFEDFKNSFKSMMMAFTNFIEAAGLEIGQDESGAQIIVLKSELERLRKVVQAGEAKMREESISRNEFEEYKAAASEKEAKGREDYVTRGEFERFRDAVREVI